MTSIVIGWLSAQKSAPPSKIGKVVKFLLLRHASKHRYARITLLDKYLGSVWGFINMLQSVFEPAVPLLALAVVVVVEVVRVVVICRDVSCDFKLLYNKAERWLLLLFRHSAKSSNAQEESLATSP